MTDRRTSSRRAPWGLMSRFRRDEDGSLIVFALYVFVIMLMVGGMAMDLMRFEAERKQLQNTIDSAVLAASDLKQRADSEDVVRSFFAKTGYDPDTAQVIVASEQVGNGDLIGRTVTASTNLKLDTMLMGLAGVPTLTTLTGGTANERIQNVEISLVLDISGSMRWGLNNTQTTPNRITELRKAVEQFVDIVLQVECDGSGNCIQSPNTDSTTINIVPYAGHVNIGPDMFELLGGNRWHSWSSCKEVTDADFNHADLPMGSGNQLPHFMKWAIDWAEMKWGWCPKDEAAVIVAENDAERLKDFIRNVRLQDGTATHVGMKYGLALLNPSSRWLFSALNQRGIVDAAYKQRPANFDDEVVKYVILMTDGQTTDQWRPSDFSYGAAYDETSPSHAAIMDRYGSVDSGGSPNAPQDVEYGYNAKTKYKEGGITHSRSRNIQNLLAMCDEAKKPAYGTGVNGAQVLVKEDRVTVFTIAFLAPDYARNYMRDCASTPSHFYDVRNLDVGTAFTSIARTINQLRLTN